MNVTLKTIELGGARGHAKKVISRMLCRLPAPSVQLEWYASNTMALLAMLLKDAAKCRWSQTPNFAKALLLVKIAATHVQANTYRGAEGSHPTTHRWHSEVLTLSRPSHLSQPQHRSCPWSKVAVPDFYPHYTTPGLIS